MSDHSGWDQDGDYAFAPCSGVIGSPSLRFIRDPVASHHGGIGIDDLQWKRNILPQDPVRDIQQPVHVAWARDPDRHPLSTNQRRIIVSRKNPRFVHYCAKVKVVQPSGPDTLVLIHLNDTPVTCRIYPESHAVAGEHLDLMFDLWKLAFFDRDGSTHSLAACRT